MKRQFKLLKCFLIVLFLLVSQISCKSTISQSSSMSDSPTIWKGAGYQYDVGHSWDIIVSFKQENQQFKIQYPSISCSGYWRLLDFDNESFEFREIITEGQDKCTNNGRVVLKKKDDLTYEFYYYWPDDQELSAYGVIFKR